MKNLRTYIALFLIISIAASSASCTATANAADLMDGISANRVTGKPADSAFTASMADFSIRLFKRAITDNKNSLISPLSVMLALAMTANGADNETLAQMEKLLGGGIRLDELNEYLHSYTGAFPNTDKAKLTIANSIWFRSNKDRLQVASGFLQRNADYYGADAYSCAFDSQTVNDINSWVNSNTNGMIERIIDEIEENNLLFLINAIMFDAEWQNVYYKENIRKGDFTDITGTVSNVDFMHSAEYAYLDDGMATGFMKPYAGGAYSFAALLPNEGIPIDAYIKTLTGEGFLDTISNAQNEVVDASMPKYEYEYDISMNDALIALSMPDAFDAEKADFGRMVSSSDGNLYISEVLHKTFISVDELGTKAGAVTMVAMSGGSSGPTDIKTVRLDRPFVYAIIDNATNLPMFIGTVMMV
jgi:serpin B